MRSVVSLAQLEGWVSRFEETGGWVTLVFHDVCAGCSSSALDPALFADFLAWLAPRSSRGTVVRTVTEMTGGALQPSVAGPLPAPRLGPNLVQNGSFESRVSTDAAPRCWQRGDPGEKKSAWSRSDDATDGATSERLDGASTTALASRRLRMHRDSGACAIPLVDGVRYRLSARVEGASRVALSYALRDSGNLWGGWRDGTAQAASATWTRVVLDLPALPAEAAALAVGIVALDAAEMFVDDVRVEEVVSPAQP
jgi:hypothetical protein